MLLIRSSILGLFPELAVGMSTRLGGVSPEPPGMNTGLHVGDDDANVHENRRRLCDALGIAAERLATQHQVHENRSTVVEAPCHVDANDALLTATPGVYLAVGVADCQAVLLYDRNNRVVAAAHAGWRGAAAHIVTRTVERIADTFGTRAVDIFAFVAPCASACCYEVDEAVASQFDPAYSTRRTNGKFMLDMKRATHGELRALGVPSTQIEVSPMCTICMPQFFHSHRRDGLRSGRMMAIVGIR